MEERRVPVDWTDVAYTTIGRGRRIVTLHGGPQLGHRYLRPGLDRLADGFEVVYYDQRGCGLTPAGEGVELTLMQHVRDLEAVRTGLGIERLNLVGHSVGGILGLLYAAEFPDRVASLVVANPGPPLDRDLGERLGAEMTRRSRPQDLEEFETVAGSEGFAARDPKTLERYFQLMYAPFFDDRENADRIDFGFTPITAQNVVGAEGRQIAGLDVDPDELLSRVACPTLVVYGANDPIPIEFARSVADRAPNATLAVLDGVNHFGFVEAPERFFGAVVPFLEELAAER